MDTGSWWWTGSSGVLQSMGSQRVRHDWATELTLTWFLMELFLHSSLATYWTPTNLAGPSSSVISFCLFILFMGFSRPEYWRALAFPPPVDHVLSGADSQGHALKPSTKPADMPGTSGCSTAGLRWPWKASQATECWSTCCLGAGAKALLVSPGTGCEEGWTHCCRMPWSGELPGLTFATSHPETDLSPRSGGLPSSFVLLGQSLFTWELVQLELVH